MQGAAGRKHQLQQNGGTLPLHSLPKPPFPSIGSPAPPMGIRASTPRPRQMSILPDVPVGHSEPGAPEAQ